MPTKLSPVREGWPLLPGLKLKSRGKVRDTYELGNDLLLVVATDCISINDFTLEARIADKGIILTAMNHFWLTFLERAGFKTHLVAAGADIDKYLPIGLRENVDLQSRAMVVHKKFMAKFEFVLRGYLTGSGWKEYQRSGTVCGNALPPGLQDGDQLPAVISTPTTKAEEGHDEPVPDSMVREKHPGVVENLLRAFQVCSEEAQHRGILFADTKFEVSEDGTIADEVLTPDASRCWDRLEWRESRKPNEGRKPPASLDKQFVRDWGKTVGIDKLDPKNPEDVDKVHAMKVPDAVIRKTIKIYRYIFWRLTGMTIEHYLRKLLNIHINERSRQNVLVVCGSESDLPEVSAICGEPDVAATIFVHVMSCHRNPEEVREFASNVAQCFAGDAIIGIGGKALALPGIIDAWLAYFGSETPVVGVALGKPGSEALLAAQLSIKQLPGTPVIMDEMTGEPYSGPEGLRTLLMRIDEGELPPPKPRTKKPVVWNAWRKNM